MRHLTKCIAVVGAVLHTSLCFGGVTFAQLKIEAAPAALDKELIARFPFENTGSTPVRITSVKTDCSCTTSTLAKEFYAPGEKGEVVVNFDIKSRQGSQTRTIIVALDDPQQPRQILTLTAALPQILQTSTTGLLWAAGEEPVAKTIVVKTPENPPVREVRARIQNAALNAEVERVSPTEFRVHVKPAAGTTNVTTTLVMDGVVEGEIVKHATAFVRVR